MHLAFSVEVSPSVMVENNQYTYLIPISLVFIMLHSLQMEYEIVFFEYDPIPLMSVWFNHLEQPGDQYPK